MKANIKPPAGLKTRSHLRAGDDAVCGLECYDEFLDHMAQTPLPCMNMENCRVDLETDLRWCLEVQCGVPYYRRFMPGAQP